MPYKISSYAEGRVLVNRIYGDLTLEDWFYSAEEMVNHIRQQPFNVNFLLDMSGLGKHPVKLTDFAEATTWLDEPNIDWVIHVTDNSVMKMLGSAAIGSIIRRYRQARSMRDGLNFLIDMDAYLYFIDRNAILQSA